MNIPFLNLKKNYETIKDEVNEKIQNVLNNCNYILGPELTDFENNFAKYCGVKHFIGVANGTDALEIALKSIELANTDEILVQGNTFVSTCLGVVSNNYKLVLCDCDENTYQISIADIEKKITKNTKVLLIVHLYGLISNMDKISELCIKHNLILIEDVAQAHGAEWNGKKAGSFGKISCFSFYPGKNLGAYGDGGGIVTNCDDLKRKILMIRNTGSLIKYHHDIIGRNSRLDTIQAAILDVKLKYLDDNNNKRRINAGLYIKYLNDNKNVQLPLIIDNSTPVYHLFVIQTNYRDDLQDYLKNKGIVSMVHYPIPCGEIKAFEHLALCSPKNCLLISNKILSLPMYPELTEDEIKYICNNINNFFKEKNNIIHKFKTIKTENKGGLLHCINELKFDTRRVFYIDNFSKNNLSRGHHANKTCKEFLFLVNGSVKISLTTQKNIKTTMVLNKNEGVMIERMIWLEYKSLCDDTNIIVLCDEPYDNNDNNNGIFNFDDFINGSYTY
jgi:dTDP-4-amino-4,6-dideoxygalactose transaminase/dTDP-4-dehydrorhamnose 3,5-epimerase-like enzyme